MAHYPPCFAAGPRDLHRAMLIWYNRRCRLPVVAGVGGCGGSGGTHGISPTRTVRSACLNPRAGHDDLRRSRRVCSKPRERPGTGAPPTPISLPPPVVTPPPRG